MNGWVKIHRSILDWRWWSEADTLRMFLYLIIAANVEDKDWKNITVRRGQLVTTVAGLSATLKMSIKQVRTSLDRLEETHEIGKQTTNKYTLITICNYETYQVNEISVRQALGQTKGKQRANKPKESTPRTPLIENLNKKERINYYSSLRGCAREEEKQQQQLLFIFFLKGSSDPKSEVANFITWNKTPERVAAWEKYSEADRYEMAEKRWKVKTAKLPGYTEKAEEILTEICKKMAITTPDFCAGIYNKQKYPVLLDGSSMTIICTEKSHIALESSEIIQKRQLLRFGVQTISYNIRK